MLGSSKYFFESFIAESSNGSAFTMLLRNIVTSNLYSSPLPVLGSSLLTEEPVLAAAGSISAVKAETEGQEPSVRAGKLHWSVDARQSAVHNTIACACVQVMDFIVTLSIWVKNFLF